MTACTPGQLSAHCLGKPGAYVEYPFGSVPACVKVSGKVFAEIYPQGEDTRVTLKCDPPLAEFYRRQYPGVVVRGYHCPPVQQPHRNTVLVRGIERGLLLQMVDDSYALVVQGLTKGQRRALEAGGGDR